MATNNTPASTDNVAVTPKVAGLIQKAFGSLFKSDPKAAHELMAETALMSGAALGKAEDLLTRAGGEGPITIIEDLWDGPPDDHLTTTSAHGPGSTVAEGGVPVGPSQSASGSGAAKMGREYSNPAPQSGVQVATEKLGRALAKHRAVIGTLLETAKSQQGTLEMLMTTVAGLRDDLALMKAAAPVVAKSDEPPPFEKKDEKEDDKEEKGDESAKSFLVSAKDALVKAHTAEIDGRPKAAARHFEEAEAFFAKARDAATEEGPLAKAIETFGEVLAKAGRSNKAENQDKWPNGSGGAVGKSETPAQPTTETLMAMQAKIDAAVNGFAVLKGSIAEVMGVVSGQSAGTGLPPLYALAKSNPELVAGKMDKVNELLAAGQITRDEADRASDALSVVKAVSEGRIDQRIADARIAGLPVVLKAEVFGLAA